MFAYNVYLNNSKHFRALTDSLKSMVDERVFKNLVSHSEKISLRLFLLVSKIAHVSGIAPHVLIGMIGVVVLRS